LTVGSQMTADETKLVAEAETLVPTARAASDPACDWMRRANQHNAKRQCRNALLELDAAVHRDEDLVLTAHSAQQLAVLDPGPAATGNGVYGMTMELRRKAYW